MVARREADPDAAAGEAAASTPTGRRTAGIAAADRNRTAAGPVRIAAAGAAARHVRRAAARAAAGHACAAAGVARVHVGIEVKRGMVIHAIVTCYIH